MTRTIDEGALTEQSLRDQHWLALDTATANMTIAIMKGLDVVAMDDSTVERNHSVRLIPEMETLLAAAGIRMRDIRAIAVGRGPGSYTGVRIGVTVAKTLAWSLKLPLVGVSSIGALAFGEARKMISAELAGGSGSIASASAGMERGAKTWIVPMLDARRKQAFTALYSWEAGEEQADETVSTADSPAADGSAAALRFTEPDVQGIWRQLAHDRIALVADWTDHLAELYIQLPEDKRPLSIVFTGETEPFTGDAEKLSERIGLPVRCVTQAVHGRDIAWLAWDRLVRGDHDDVHNLVPNYTQLAEAEQKLLARSK